ncbi:MAG TPA: hypothetical protein VGV15_12965, partial [Terriglobales bacterium]|nr:hypothetical protein [Terriglobales bacterium]
RSRWLGGWGTNSIVSYQTGHPWTPFNSIGPDTNKDGYRTDRLVPKNGIISSRYLNGSPANGLLDSQDPANPNWISFTCPTSVNDGLWCNSPIKRNSLIGPGGADVDLNVTKNFKINERAGVTFQANFFNLFNHPNFIGPTAGPGGSSNFAASDFSKSRTTWSTGGADGGHRATQLALRFDF